MFITILNEYQTKIENRYRKKKIQRKRKRELFSLEQVDMFRDKLSKEVKGKPFSPQVIWSPSVSYKYT